MKTRRPTHWLGSSKIGSKRSSLPLLAALLLAFSLVPPQPLTAQSVVVDGTRRPDGLHLDIEVVQYDDSTLIRNIQQGFTAEVVYLIRLYEAAEGLGSLLGDRLVVEYAPTLRAQHDLFYDAYVIQRNNGVQQVAETLDELRRGLFSLDGYWLPLADLSDPESAYIRVIVRVRDFRLSDSLGIIGIVLPNYTHTLPEARLDLTAGIDG